MTRHASMPLHLRDGTRVYLRPLRTTDREELLKQLGKMSPQSRYSRFLSAVDTVSEDMADQLIEDVDGVNHVAVVLLTEEGDEPVALGRFVRNRKQPDHAEVAFAVHDDWQGRSAGTLMSDALKTMATQRGVRYFTATVLTANEASLRMMAGFGRTVSLAASGPGVVDTVVDLFGEPGTGPGATEAGPMTAHQTLEMPAVDKRRNSRPERT